MDAGNGYVYLYEGGLCILHLTMIYCMFVPEYVIPTFLRSAAPLSVGGSKSVSVWCTIHIEDKVLGYTGNFVETKGVWRRL